MSTLQSLPFDAFEDEETTTPAPAPTVTSAPPAVRSTITATKVQSSTHLLVEPSAWSWEQLRDYVVSRLESIPDHPGVRRDPVREKAIFSGFLKRYGARAVEIARFALETQQTPGWWHSAPIQPTRFCRGSDPYFAEAILAQLAQ
jgi:hypothetical protein